MVMVKNHPHHPLEPKYLLDNRSLKITNERSLLLVASNGKVCKINLNNVKPCTTLDLTEDTWNSFLNFIKKYLSKP